MLLKYKTPEVCVCVRAPVGVCGVSLWELLVNKPSSYCLSKRKLYHLSCCLLDADLAKLLFTELALAVAICAAIETTEEGF